MTEKKPDYYNVLWDKDKKAKGKKHDPLVNVNLARSSALLGDNVVLKVQVFSRIKKGRIQQGERIVTRNTTMPELRKLAGVMAGALSEECCRNYGDFMVAKEYEHMAHDAFDQIVAKLERGVLTVGTVEG